MRHHNSNFVGQENNERVVSTGTCECLIVRLKSGGPKLLLVKLTIRNVNGKGQRD